MKRLGRRNCAKLGLALWCCLLGGSLLSAAYGQTPAAPSPPAGSDGAQAPETPRAVPKPDTYKDGSPKYNPKRETRKEYWNRVEEWRKKAYPAPKPDWKPRHPTGLRLKSLFGNEIYLPPPPDLDDLPKMPSLPPLPDISDFPKMPKK